MDYKELLNEQIKELENLSKENAKSVLPINVKAETAINLSEQIRKLCSEANT